MKFSTLSKQKIQFKIASMLKIPPTFPTANNAQITVTTIFNCPDHEMTTQIYLNMAR